MPRPVNHMRARVMQAAAAWLTARDAYLYAEYPPEETEARALAFAEAQKDLAVKAGWYLMGERCNTAMYEERSRRLVAANADGPITAAEEALV